MSIYIVILVQEHKQSVLSVCVLYVLASTEGECPHHHQIEIVFFSRN